MKKLIAIMSLLIAFGVQAQQKKMMNHDRQMTEEMFMKKFDGLDLTQEQEKKLKAFYKENETKRAEMKAERMNRSADRNEMKPQGHTMREDHQNKIKEILTPAQFEKFQENRKTKFENKGRKNMNKAENSKGMKKHHKNSAQQLKRNKS